MKVLVKLDRERRGRKADLPFSLGPAEERRFEWGKKIKGRKRHIVTDLLGNILAMLVHTANFHDMTHGEKVF
jgi:hypothetical protein